MQLISWREMEAGKVTGKVLTQQITHVAECLKPKTMSGVDLCLTCSQGVKSIHVTTWDVSTCIVGRVFSCDTGVKQESDSSTRGASGLCLLGNSHILCASRSLPFIYVWNIKKEQVQMKIACSGVVGALDCSADGTYCAAAIGEKIHIWEVCTGHLLAVVSLHYQPVKVLKFTWDGVHLLSGGDDGRVVVWRLARVLSDAFDSTGCHLPFTSQSTPPLPGQPDQTRHVWSHHSLPVTSIHCGSGGLNCRVATGSLDQTCKLYELSSGSLLCSFLFDFGLTAVTMDLAEQRLFVGGSNGQISQINLFSYHSTRTQGMNMKDLVKGDETQSRFNGHRKPITGLAVTTWAHVLVSSSEEETARVWDIDSRQTLRTVNLKGSVSAMLICGKELDFNVHRSAQSKGPQPWWHYPVLHIQPFKKQLCHKSASKTSGERSDDSSLSISTHVRGIDPLCEIASLQEVESSYTLPSSSHLSNESQRLVTHKLKQELSEIKDVHKRLYSFMLDELLTSTTT